MKLLLDIVFVFIKIQLLSFGGGHASIPVVETEIVDVKHWLSIEEFSNLLAMDELTPGPLAINCATFVGNKLAGIVGAIAATVGCIIPSCIIALIFSKMYKQFFENKTFRETLRNLSYMVIALLAVTIITMSMGTFYAEQTIRFGSIVIAGLSFFVLMKYETNPLYVIMLGGVFNVIINVIIT